MARRKKVTARIMAPTPVPVIENPVLSHFGLVKGDQLRFRMNPGESWEIGKVMNDNKDGSITLYTQMTRSIQPENCQRKTIGPRGGVVWVDLVEALDRSSDT